MPTIKIQAQLSKEDLLDAVQQLSLTELEKFVQETIAIQAKHHTPSVSNNETELLLNINQGVSPDIQNRYQILIKN